VPGIYQALVLKAYELRVTMIGRRAFAAKVCSQERRTGRLDWRKAYAELHMEPFELPPEVAEQCFAVMQKLDIVFGCFDFIVRPDGRYVFLEVNYSEVKQAALQRIERDLPLHVQEPEGTWDEGASKPLAS
jgi:glutathione synthase/RimK-type ligase-like ATP-grasp enzyme